MKPQYCYWSVATGVYSELMDECVKSARKVGNFKEFHILADKDIPNAECYDWMGIDHTDGMFKLAYLKSAISRLNFEYYVWVDADTIFNSNPDQILATLGRSPVHFPLFDCPDDSERIIKIRNISVENYQKTMRTAGLLCRARICRSAFWVVKRSAIDVLCELAQHYYAVAKTQGVIPHGDCALSFAMQMLCGDLDAHSMVLRRDLWWSDDISDYQVDVCGFGEDQKSRVPAVLHQPTKRRIKLGANLNAFYVDERSRPIV